MSGEPRALLTPADVAALLAVTPQTVRNMVRRGELAASRVGRQFRVSPAEVRRLLGIDVPGSGAVQATGE